MNAGSAKGGAFRARASAQTQVRPAGRAVCGFESFSRLSTRALGTERPRARFSASSHCLARGTDTGGGTGFSSAGARGLSPVGHPVVVCVGGNFLIGAGQV